MKKRIALFLAALFAFSMVATSAFASGVDAHATCQHTSGTRTERQTTYIESDDEYHKIYLTEVYYCTSCGAVIDASAPQYIEKETHTYTPWHYEKSVHEGKYLTHYAIYSKSCTVCAYEQTKHELTGCTQYNCQDVQCLQN